MACTRGEPGVGKASGYVPPRPTAYLIISTLITTYPLLVPAARSDKHLATHPMPHGHNYIVNYIGTTTVSASREYTHTHT